MQNTISKQVVCHKNKTLTNIIAYNQNGLTFQTGNKQQQKIKKTKVNQHQYHTAVRFPCALHSKAMSA